MFCAKFVTDFAQNMTFEKENVNGYNHAVSASSRWFTGSLTDGRMMISRMFAADTG